MSTSEFLFREKKATQAAARIIQKAGGRYNYLSLVKLIYIVDREAIKSWERAVAGGPFFSLPNGPVNSAILDLVNENIPSDHWRNCLEREENDVILHNDPGDDELSEAEKDLIDFVFEQWGHLSPAALRHLTHQFPEWKNPNGGRLPISGDEILHAVGRRAEEVREISEELEETNKLRRLLEK